jgi:UPF0755 protein
MKRAGLILAALLVVAAGLSLLAWRHYQAFLATPLSIPRGGIVFELTPGSSGASIVSRLSDAGHTQAGWPWKLLMRLQPAVYRAGEYRIEHGVTPPQLLRQLEEGRVIHYEITLIEGWTFAQLIEALDNDPVLEHELDIADPWAWDPGVLFEGMTHPEGWFLPETYRFIRGDSDRDILQRAHAGMNEVLGEAWSQRMPDLPLEEPYELLILASIIEKETAVDAERDRIAGVFTRRLQKGMRLQTDPTVIYGIGPSFDGDIRRRDLRTDTPYNTYTRHGLPPTPIAMPGRKSLFAAANPADGEELYFVADGKGGHTFSRTLAEHQAAVDRLLEREQ